MTKTLSSEKEAAFNQEFLEKQAYFEDVVNYFSNLFILL